MCVVRYFVCSQLVKRRYSTSSVPLIGLYVVFVGSLRLLRALFSKPLKKVCFECCVICSFTESAVGPFDGFFGDAGSCCSVFLLIKLDICK